MSYPWHLRHYRVWHLRHHHEVYNKDIHEACRLICG